MTSRITLAAASSGSYPNPCLRSTGHNSGAGSALEDEQVGVQHTPYVEDKLEYIVRIETPHLQVNEQRNYASCYTTKVVPEVSEASPSAMTFGGRV